MARRTSLPILSMLVALVAWRCVPLPFVGHPASLRGTQDAKQGVSSAQRPIFGSAPWLIRSGKVAADQDSAFAGSTASAILLLGAAVAGAALRLAPAATVQRAAKAKKKKGVRVVDGEEIPWNLFTPKAPFKATVVANHEQPQTLTQHSDDPNWETVHVTLEHGGSFPYLEGQSLGMIAPGPDKKGDTPAKLRLYSIASSAVGDNEGSNTVSLCVKRLVEVDGKHANREVGEDLPDKASTCFPNNRVYRGVASNFVANLSPGDEVLITGPTGAEMLLPKEPDANIIMLATGTGIAPMRGYLRLLFNDEVGASADASRKFKGSAWLFLGVPRSSSILYDDEHQAYKAKFPDNFRYDYAISREQTSAAGEKMYIQQKMAEYAEELWALMQDSKTHVYMCGLKGMEKGMQEVFGPLAESKGVVWEDFAKAMKKSKRLHVEVY